MSKRELLNFIPEFGRTVHRTVEDGKVYIETAQDLEPVVKMASILSEAKPGKDFTRVALIPAETMNRAFTEGWFHDEDAWRKWANDPVNRCFRTTEGTI